MQENGEYLNIFEEKETELSSISNLLEEERSNLETQVGAFNTKI